LSTQRRVPSFAQARDPLDIERFKPAATADGFSTSKQRNAPK